jgi:hypothetical protein
MRSADFEPCALAYPARDRARRQDPPRTPALPRRHPSNGMFTVLAGLKTHRQV